MRLSDFLDQAYHLFIAHPLTSGAVGALAAGLISWFLTRAREA